MLKHYFFLLLFHLTVFYAVAQKLDPLENFGSNPGNLNAYYHAGKSREQDTLPLVIALHGCAQTAEQLNKISGLSDLADRYGFHLLFPEQKPINNLNNCFNWFLAKDLNPEDGESQSIYQQVLYVLQNRPVKRQQLYICGFSAGAEMSVIMLMNFPDLFQGGAIMAGGAYYGKLSSWKAISHLNKPPDYSDKELRDLTEKTPGGNQVLPPLIVLNGQKDKVVNPLNSDLLVRQWLALAADTNLTKTEFLIAAKQSVHKTSWITREQKFRVIRYVIEETGHTLPVDPGNGKKQGGQEGAFSEDLDFYCLYYVFQDFGLIPLE